MLPHGQQCQGAHVCPASPHGQRGKAKRVPATADRGEQTQQAQQARGNAPLTTPTPGRSRGVHGGKTGTRHDPLRTRLPLARLTHTGGARLSQRQQQHSRSSTHRARLQPLRRLPCAARGAAFVVPPSPPQGRYRARYTGACRRSRGVCSGCGRWVSATQNVL
jgi:hypothetical protein